MRSVTLFVNVVALSGLLACAHDRKQIVNATLPTPDPRVQVLRVGAYTDAAWSNFGFYDKDGSFEHVYGGAGDGSFSYGFSAPAMPLGAIEVTSRLSAESSDIGKEDELSDVTLSIEGVDCGTQTVRADDRRGSLYAWTCREPHLLEKLGAGGRFELTFAVKPDAAHRHGISIYGVALDAGEAGTPPTLRFIPR